MKARCQFMLGALGSGQAQCVNVANWGVFDETGSIMGFVCDKHRKEFVKDFKVLKLRTGKQSRERMKANAARV